MKAHSVSLQLAYSSVVGRQQQHVTQRTKQGYKSQSRDVSIDSEDRLWRDPAAIFSDLAQLSTENNYDLRSCVILHHNASFSPAAAWYVAIFLCAVFPGRRAQKPHTIEKEHTALPKARHVNCVSPNNVGSITPLKNR
jgi:hypothetical protein